MNQGVREVTLLSLLMLSMMTTAVNPGCKCVKFTSTYDKPWGIFHSVNYPDSYPVGIQCLLYSFQGLANTIVEVIFDTFNLVKPNETNGCYKSDYLKLFLHLDTDGVNEETPWNSIICGSGHTNKSYFSSGRHLVMQFHSASFLHHTSQNSLLPAYHFSGRFRFLNASEYKTQGRVMPGTMCDYQFISSNRTLNKGKFFSPNFPSTYPHNVKCLFQFHGGLHERVKIEFEMVALQQGDYSCLNKTDMIRVIDGSSTNSPVISMICNHVQNLEVLSSGSDIQVEFYGNSETPGQGFQASFQFLQVRIAGSLNPSFSSVTTGSLYDAETHHTKTNKGLTQASTSVPQCIQTISSDAGRNGTFSSPNYPHFYPPNTQCVYQFFGHGKQKIQIEFIHFNLLHTVSSSSSSSSPLLHINGSNLAHHQHSKQFLKCQKKYILPGKRVDSLSMFGHQKGKLEKILEFCGGSESLTPPKIMSSDHRLTLKLESTVTSSTFGIPPQGFQALYRFREDLGIENGEMLDEYPCGFVFNSSVSSHGYFWSPNHPGFYPRGIECHYFFHGESYQRVEILFSTFNVFGRAPCTNPEGDDYIEFSNYMPVDQEYNRTCGILEKKSFGVVSSRNFFRITFRSNWDVYTSIGFKANYTFVFGSKESKNIQTKTVQTFDPKLLLKSTQNNFQHFEDSYSNSLPSAQISILFLIFVQFFVVLQRMTTTLVLQLSLWFMTICW